MPTELGNPFSPLWRGSYPHMLKEDMPVWNRFLDRNPALYDRIYYDVRVGGVMPGPEYGDEKMRRMFWQNTAKRIDALGETKDTLELIEVATRPGLRAVGQLQTYIALWFEDPKLLPKTITPVLVCQGIDEDLARSLNFYGVRTKVVF
jgi:hypothetical protein